MDIALTGSARERGAQIVRAIQESALTAIVYIGDEEFNLLEMWLELHMEYRSKMKLEKDKRKVDYTFEGRGMFRVRKTNHFRIFTP